MNSRMNKILLSTILTGGILLGNASAWALTRITKIEFTGKSSPHQIMISGDGPIEFEKVDNAADKQVILELKNAKLANANVGRRIDTSSFNSKVSLISPYNVESQNSVRVIVQLRDSADTSVITAGNKVVMGIDGEPDGAVIAAASAAEETPAPRKSAPQLVEPTTVEQNYDDPSGRGKDGKTAADRIQQVTDAHATQKYVGSRITIQVKDAAISDVFRLIGEASGFNVVLGADVTGTVTLSLVDVPWDLALDTILSTMKLGAERRGNVLRVASLATLTQEKQLELSAKQANEKNAPRVTRIIPVSYADPTKLIGILQKFGSGNAGSGEAGRDTILLDERTNSLVIQEIPENIERMAKLIDILDKPTPQVLIESKIIEATEEFSKGISGNLAAATESSSNYNGASASNGSLQKLTSGSPFPNQTTLTASDSFFAAGTSISTFTGARLKALLTLSEAESKSKIISSPRTLVLNRQQATIVQGTPVLVPVTVLDTQTGLPRTSTSVQQANLSLTVKPTVTNDGNIIMDLNVSSDTPKQIGDQSGIGSRNIKTNVVAESGSTLVIGGVYQLRDSDAEGGFPILRKIPILGHLFGFENNSKSRSELLIFVSPKVINEKEINPEGESKKDSSQTTTTEQI